MFSSEFRSLVNDANLVVRNLLLEQILRSALEHSSLGAFDLLGPLLMSRSFRYVRRSDGFLAGVRIWIPWN